ncbi:MAG TPA: hypothetical protein VNT79_14560 [Phycisphaerae bacterium]|nr:hypothetical protein [Phycisphaerae bacterium]
MPRQHFRSIRTLTIGALAVAAPVHADVYPVSTSVRSEAYALVAPHPDHPADEDEQFGATGDFDTSTHQFDTSTDAQGTLTCDMTSSTTAHVEPSGISGNAMMHNHWIATNTKQPADANNYGVFGGETYFYYSFMVDSPSTLSVTCTATYTGDLDGQDPATVAMRINHYLTFGQNDYTEIPLDGEVTVDYELESGFHSFRVEHFPNSGIGPWVNVDLLATTAISFTIDSEPPVDTDGDMNCDGVTDVDDVHGFALALADPEEYFVVYAECGEIFRANMNHDEFIDGLDLQEFTDTVLNP